jgi:hypothetical protein
MKPQFKVSYRGESEYELNGRTYRVRYFAQDDGHYNGDYYKTGIEPFVGCLSNKHDEHHKFPSSETIEAFRAVYPGIVGARYVNNAFTEVEYTSEPQTGWKGDTLYAKWWLDCIAKLY